MFMATYLYGFRAGIIISAVGDFEGTKASIANSYLIRNHWRRAVELNPNDATAHHLLGRCRGQIVY